VIFDSRLKKEPAMANHGTKITGQDESGGALAELLRWLFPNVPANGSLSFVQNRGNFTQP
jgi:hypothetical protein